VHLWDAVTGELRCSYLGYDDKDEVTAAFSVAFSADGSQVCDPVCMHAWTSLQTSCQRNLYTIVLACWSLQRGSSVVSARPSVRSDCWSQCMPDASMQLAAGGNKLLRLFDVATPGRQCQVIKTHSKKHPGQPGELPNTRVHRASFPHDN